MGFDCELKKKPSVSLTFPLKAINWRSFICIFFHISAFFINATEPLGLPHQGCCCVRLTVCVWLHLSVCLLVCTCVPICVSLCVCVVFTGMQSKIFFQADRLEAVTALYYCTGAEGLLFHKNPTNIHYSIQHLYPQCCRAGRPIGAQ